MPVVVKVAVVVVVLDVEGRGGVVDGLDKNGEVHMSRGGFSNACVNIGER